MFSLHALHFKNHNELAKIYDPNFPPPFFLSFLKATNDLTGIVGPSGADYFHYSLCRDKSAKYSPESQCNAIRSTLECPNSEIQREAEEDQPFWKNRWVGRIRVLKIELTVENVLRLNG